MTTYSRVNDIAYLLDHRYNLLGFEEGDWSASEYIGTKQCLDAVESIPCGYMRGYIDRGQTNVYAPHWCRDDYRLIE